MQAMNPYVDSINKDVTDMLYLFDIIKCSGKRGRRKAAGWMIECYKELAAFGAQYGVKIGIQNHGDMLQTAEQCVYVLENVDSEWIGLIIDKGNFKTEDPYNDIAAVVPYANNCQFKESVFGLGREIY
jgi:sugar phosphate isomerase/epimerase